MIKVTRSTFGCYNYEDIKSKKMIRKKEVLYKLENDPIIFDRETQKTAKQNWNAL